MSKISNPTNHMRPTQVGAFILPSVGRVPLLTIAQAQTPATALHIMMATGDTHCGRSRFDRVTNRPSDCGARAVQSCAGRLVDGRDDCGAGADAPSLAVLTGRV